MNPSTQERSDESAPLSSMTGFGRGEASSGPIKVSVELGTVNRKQFDCNVSLPREYLCLETPLHKLLRSQITRGYVKGNITVTMTPGASEESPIDLTTLRQQVHSIRQIAHELNLLDNLSASDLLQIPEVLHAKNLPENPDDVWPLIEQATEEALLKLKEMRVREGTALCADLRARLEALHGIVRQIEKIAPSVPKTYQAQLQKRLAELLPSDVQADPDMVAREVAIFADHCDISEELTRLESHFVQADKIFTAGGACGRALDFLCQEFFREINTTGSKANNAEIAKLVISFKAGLETVREQVQNIE